MIWPSPGLGTALLLFLLTACFWFASLGLAEWRKKLGSVGWIPEHIDDIRRILQSVATFAFILAAIALLPPLFDPLIPIAIVVFVIVAIWSSRDSLRDFAAGWLLQSEGQIKLGVTLKINEFYGQVVRVGFRTTTLKDGKGNQLVIPNRELVGNRIVIDDQRWPRVSVRVHIPIDTPVANIHVLLTHAARCSPWAAPYPIEIKQSDAHEKTWIVHARILELRFEEPFTAALREQVDDYCRNEK